LIDLHRHPAAFGLYKAFCVVFGISRLVREDGSLSILRGFKSAELLELSHLANWNNAKVSRKFPYRLVLTSGR
jgi:hypothetical protein